MWRTQQPTTKKGSPAIKQTILEQTVYVPTDEVKHSFNNYKTMVAFWTRSVWNIRILVSIRSWKMTPSKLKFENGIGLYLTIDRYTHSKEIGYIKRSKVFRLYASIKEPIQLERTVLLHCLIGDHRAHIWFCVVHNFEFSVLLRSLSVEGFMREIFAMKRNVVLRHL